MAGNNGGGKEPVKINDDIYWRKLTPLECERLQTVPDNYTNHVSNTQRYKMLGNGWTIEVIAHILQEHRGNTMSIVIANLLEWRSRHRERGI
jgi:site-specific DNA-cytosine methylase